MTPKSVCRTTAPDSESDLQRSDYQSNLKKYSLALTCYNLYLLGSIIKCLGHRRHFSGRASSWDDPMQLSGRQDPKTKWPCSTLSCRLDLSPHEAKVRCVYLNVVVLGTLLSPCLFPSLWVQVMGCLVTLWKEFRSSVQGAWHLRARETPYAPQTVSKKLSKCCLWNGSNVCLTDDGPFSSFLVLSRKIVEHYVCQCLLSPDARWWDICGFVSAGSVSRSLAFQTFRDARHLWWLLCPPAYLHDPGMARTVHPQKFSKWMLSKIVTESLGFPFHISVTVASTFRRVSLVQFHSTPECLSRQGLSGPFPTTSYR